MDADRIAAWHDQFAPAPATVRDGVDPAAGRADTVEHPAGADGVFAPAVVVEAEPEAKAAEGEEHAA